MREFLLSICYNVEGKLKSIEEAGKLDSNGQRMNIGIDLVHSGKGLVSFISGWMIRPNGQITCNTPLGG